MEKWAQRIRYVILAVAFVVGIFFPAGVLIGGINLVDSAIFFTLGLGWVIGPHIGAHVFLWIASVVKQAFVKHPHSVQPNTSTFYDTSKWHAWWLGAAGLGSLIAGVLRHDISTSMALIYLSLATGATVGLALIRKFEVTSQLRRIA